VAAVSRHIDPQLKELLVARLRQRGTGELTGAVREAATALNLGERTVWRWLGAETLSRRPRARYEITEADRDAYWDWRGNVAAARRERVAAGAAMPSLRTMHAAFARAMTPAERAAVVDGVEGRRRHEVYLRWAPAARNALWEADHVELAVLVAPPGPARKPCKPWATFFVDGFSRLVMGWALSLVPTAAVVLAALRQGIVVDADRGPFGGVPERLRPDNGLEFVANAIERSCAALGIALDPAPAYQGYSKGKVERVNRTADQEFLAGLPFYTGGPRAADGHLFGPDAAPMSLALFVDKFAGWVNAYNTTRVHSELGETPLARWSADTTPLREVPAEQLRWMLMADTERTIAKDGVHFGGISFIAGALNGRVGERVQVRYMPHDLRHIEIFRGDEWLATAYPQGVLSEDQRSEVLAARRRDAAELGRRQRRASRRARGRLAPITAPGAAIAETSVITAESARAERPGLLGTAGQRSGMRRLAMSTLLDLHTDFAYWNQEITCCTPPGEAASAEQAGALGGPAVENTAGGS
jgi:putative transposase